LVSYYDSQSAAIWNVKPSITKGPLGMTWQWTGMRSNPNCRILIRVWKSNLVSTIKAKRCPALPWELKHLTYQEERKSTETPLVVASERGQAISVRSPRPLTPPFGGPRPPPALRAAHRASGPEGGCLRTPSGHGRTKRGPTQLMEPSLTRLDRRHSS
jgi:hypothetical protein